MRIFNILLISILLFPAVSFSDDQAAVREFQEDIEMLKENSNTMAPNEIIGKAGQLMDKLGDSSNDENKRLVEAVKVETMLFYGELANYDTFLDKISDPSFFNFERAMDLKNLEAQRTLAIEYEKKSGELLNYATSLPSKIRASLKKKGFSDSTINSVLKGIADAEAERKNTPTDMLTLRVQHASILKDGLTWLKMNFGKWHYDTAQGYLGFSESKMSDYWETKIVTPLVNTENSINEAVRLSNKS